jgi:mannose-6-phosphate isomerase-like protein (cupin superfamily)
MSKPFGIALVTFVLITATPAFGRAAEPYRGNVEAQTEENEDFRHVLFTGRNIQVVAMALRPGEAIGQEVHAVDQCFFFVDGRAQTVVEGKSANAGKNGVLCVPAGTRHDIRNVGRDSLKLFTTYAPPQHPAGTVHRTKADAQRAEAAQQQEK